MKIDQDLLDKVTAAIVADGEMVMNNLWANFENNDTRSASEKLESLKFLMSWALMSRSQGALFGVNYVTGLMNGSKGMNPMTLMAMDSIKQVLTHISDEFMRIATDWQPPTPMVSQLEVTLADGTKMKVADMAPGKAYMLELPEDEQKRLEEAHNASTF